MTAETTSGLQDTPSGPSSPSGQETPGADQVLTRRCANCGTPVGLRYCPRCGQDTRDCSRSLRHFLRDGIETLTNFDSRLLRTLGTLMTRPGRLTAQYVAGRRAPFVSPLRLYLFTSLVFTLTLAVTNTALFVAEAIPRDQRGFLGASFLIGTPPGDFYFGGFVIPLRRAESLEALRQLGVLGVNLAFIADLDHWRQPIPVPPEVLTSLSPPPKDVSTLHRVGHGIVRHLDRPEELNRLMSARLTEVMFLLMPVFAVLTAILFRQRNLYFVDHLVLSLHLHTFGFVVLLGLAVVENLSGGGVQRCNGLPVVLILAGGLGGYTWVALRTVFREGAVITTVKWAVLGFTYQIAGVIGLIALLRASLG